MYINISSIGPFKPYLFIELMIWMYNLSDELKADKSSVALLSHSLLSYIFKLELTKKKDWRKMTILRQSVYKKTFT